MGKQRWSLLGRIGSLSVCFCAVGSFTYSAQVRVGRIPLSPGKSAYTRTAVQLHKSVILATTKL